MNLTKDRVNALEGYLSAPDIALPGEEKEALNIAADLIAYWKSQQPKVCKHCGSDRGSHSWSGRCLPPRNPDTTYEEAP